MTDVLGIELDRTGEVPLGVQLAWALRMRILSGALARGERLPGVRELAQSTGVNVNTVRSVYGRLEDDGLIRAEHGRGTFVSEAAPMDERVSAVAREALAAAAEAGLDPRQVAAALFSQAGTPAPAPVPAPKPADPAAARRGALRDEIAELERRLVAAQIEQADQTGPEPVRGQGARLLDEDELRAQRDGLILRLRELQEPAAGERSSSTRTATAAGAVVRFRPTLGTA
jgi:DNA-binding transcriptional regulator YhcF (GntR family)